MAEDLASDQIEKDRPPAGTACARCQALGHFCPASEYIDDTDEAQCEACLDAEDCPRIASSRVDDRDVFEVPPVKHVEPSSQPLSDAPNIDGVVARILMMDFGESARFISSGGMTIFQLRASIQKRVEEKYSGYKFSFETSADRRALIIKRVKGTFKVQRVQRPTKVMEEHTPQRSERYMTFNRSTGSTEDDPSPPLNSALVHFSNSPVVDLNSNGTPVSELVGIRGIKTSQDFVDFMGGLMADVVAGRIKPEVAKAACTAAQTMLQAVRLQREFSQNGSK